MEQYQMPPETPLRRLAAKPVVAASLCLTLLTLVGCSSEPASHLVSAEPPRAPVTAVLTTTTTTTPAVPAAGVVYTNQGPVAVAAVPGTSTTVVTQAPPILQPEVAQAQPSGEHVWIAGYWTWQNSRYEWVAGHWVMPPSSSSVWMTPHWEQEGNAYRFYEGYWN